MKKLLVLGMCATLAGAAKAQDFPGYQAGNYTGVNGVFFNPANIADSRYRFDINLFSLSTYVGNNQASFKLKTLGEFNSDSISNKVFGKNAGPSSGLVNLDIHGPSFMFNVSKKNSFAITTRVRSTVNVVDIDGKLFEKVTSDFSNDATLPYTIASNQNQRFAINAWSEFGVSYARVISEKGPHFFKGGVSLKYLGGAGNSFINIDNFKGTINADVAAQDAYLNNSTGRVGIGFAGMTTSDFDPADALKMKSTGIGADIGFVYEYRPKDAATSKGANKYKLKVGVALLDLGSIKYEKDMQRSGIYDIDITGSERLSFNELDNFDFDKYNDFFKAKPQFFTAANSNAETTYKVSLPTTLRLDVDYHVKKGFYVSGAGSFSMIGKSAKPYNSAFYSNFIVTPRIEGKILGVYLPVSYNELTKFNAGISLRVGPLFFGSGSVISALVGESKQADFHIGVRFGGLKK
jgi:hypothetical protein